jgi:Ca2+-transporting ATPase
MRIFAGSAEGPSSAPRRDAGASRIGVRHSLPGRTRLVLPDWPPPGPLQRMKLALERRGCTLLSLSAPTRSVLLRHHRDQSAQDVAALVEAVLAGEIDSAPSASAGDQVLDRAAVTDAAAVLTGLGVDASGLSRDEAARRLAACGPNATPAPQGRSQRDMLVGQFTSFPVALLLGSAVLSVATGGLVEAAVTVGVVLVNAGIGFSSENATERLIRRLSRPVEHAASTLRDSTVLTLPAREIVPGDILVLVPGSVVPADARLLSSRDLTVDESSLTGESMPVEKTAEALAGVPRAVAERDNIVHGGTVVTGGDGRAVVLRTGRNTEMARTREMIGLARPPRPVIEDKLADLGSKLALACIGMSGLVFTIGLMRGEPLIAMTKSAIALAVSAIPEGLPAVATTTLSLGARAMERDKAFVRALPAVESIGTVDTICLDKTGTLTENRMAVAATRLPSSLFAHDATTDTDTPGLIALAEVVALCNEADLAARTGSSTELALLEFAARTGVDIPELRRSRPVTELRNRNHLRRFMASEHLLGAGRHAVCVKGAPDEVLAQSSTVLSGGEARPLDEALRSAIAAANASLAAEGLRVLGVARRDGALGTGQLGGLTWLGLVGLADPVRQEAREAIDIFHRAGIRTVMITGDQAPTARSVAEQLALSRTGIIGVAEGPELAALDERALGELALRTSVFARVSPADKLRIVNALQGIGRRVAMIGDGVNDGPALRAAAVGVAMGRNGTDVAREVADIVIADDDLRQLARAIARSRATDDNIRAAIRYFLSTNLSEVLVMLVESLHGRGELETPMELFWLNLVTDILPALGLSLAEPRGDVMVRGPRDSGAPLFGRAELSGIGLDAAGIAAAALAAHFTKMARAGVGPHTRTATFLTLALAQIAQAWTLRDRAPRDAASRRLSERRLEATLAAAGALLALPFLVRPLRALLGIAPLTVTDAGLATAFAGAAFGVAEGRRIIASASGTGASSPVSRPG